MDNLWFFVGILSIPIICIIIYAIVLRPKEIISVDYHPFDGGGKWMVTECKDGQVHVSPLGEDHNLHGTSCRCKPMVDDDLIVHNSFDGREMVEQAEKIMKGLE